MYIELFLILVLALAGTSAQAVKDPLNDFCRRWGHQSAVIDSHLYIDGGWVNWNPISLNPSNYSNDGLLFQDLSGPAKGGMPQLYANLSKNSTVPTVAGGILWADSVNKIFYLFGGEYTGGPPLLGSALWGYDVILNQWNLSATTSSQQISRVSYGAGVAVDERAEGYYFGGYLSNKTVPGWGGPQLATSNLIKYDIARDIWTNNTGPDSIPRAEGVMVFIPASDSGLLIYFGGVTAPFGNETVIGAPMDTIYIYDIASSKWYTQNATGTVPEMRRRFCAGATWAQDKSSYNIYLYGGLGFPPNGTGFDDVYILTLPSFTWIKWYPTAPGPGSPHHSLTCNVINGAQMLIIGGTFPASNMCDAPDVWGTHNLNLGKNNPDNAMWSKFYPNLTEYNVPPEIVAVVGGSAKGGATKAAPDKGWNNRDLPVYFTRQATFSARTPTRSIPTATATSTQSATPTAPPPPPPPPKHANKTPTIIGASVGGGVGLVVAITALVFCYLCKRRRKNPKVPLQPAELATNQPFDQDVLSVSENPEAKYHPYSQASAGGYYGVLSVHTPHTPHTLQSPHSPHSPQSPQSSHPLYLRQSLHSSHSFHSPHSPRSPSSPQSGSPIHMNSYLPPPRPAPPPPMDKEF